MYSSWPSGRLVASPLSFGFSALLLTAAAAVAGTELSSNGAGARVQKPWKVLILDS